MRYRFVELLQVLQVSALWNYVHIFEAFCLNFIQNASDSGRPSMVRLCATNVGTFGSAVITNYCTLGSTAPYKLLRLKALSCTVHGVNPV